MLQGNEFQGSHRQQNPPRKKVDVFQNFMGILFQQEKQR